MDFKKETAALAAKQYMRVFGQERPDMESLLEVPPDPEMGDYALPCFRFSKDLRKAPPIIAKAMSEGFDKADLLSDVRNVNGYCNFYLKKAAFAKEVVETVLRAGDDYGKSDEGKGRTVCIDYSSINIAKRFHIGHLSTTMIGHSLRRINAHMGYTVVGINHLGDWGTQFGKMVCAYLKWGEKELVEKNGVDELTKLYIRFHEEAEKDPSLEDEGRLWFKKIEDGDQQALSIFTWFKEITLKDAKKTYEKLGVTFDSYNGESFYVDKMQPVVDELREKGLLIESDGAQVVDLSEENMPPCMILKRDGATLYTTRDIAAAIYRKNTYDFSKCLYVVAYQQDLHFKQMFKVIEKMGYDWYKDLKHVSFGMVSYEGQTLSTRKGNIVLLDDLLDRAVENARKIIEEKSPELPNKEEIAKQVGIGAVVFFDLYNNRIKDIDFWWDRVLNFDGETGPYAQYTHARCCSLLKKAQEAGIQAEPDWEALNNPQGQEVARLLYAFPDTVREACTRDEPSLITRYIIDLAESYNRFYYEHRILSEELAVSAARVRLTDAVRSVLHTALYLIGVAAPERM